jgi:polyisoprenoid-binding protein YceI
MLRTYNDRELPVAGEYTIDASHTSVEFIARNLVITKVRGRFVNVSGIITIGDEPERSRVDVAINVASLTTGNTQRDRHLRSADFFDTARYPSITFTSTSVKANASRTWTVTGDLTIRDTTRPISFDVTFEGAKRAPQGREHIVFSAETEVEREDWGLGWNAPLETGGVLIGKQVRIELNVEAVASPRP